MKRRALLPILLLLASAGWSQNYSAEETLAALAEEVQRAADSLVSAEGIRPYFVAARLEYQEVTQWRAERGVIFPSQYQITPSIVAEIRVGSPALDDSRFIGNPSEIFPFSMPLPLDGSPALLKRTLWILFDDAFRQACRNLTEKISWLKNHPGARFNQIDFTPPTPTQRRDTIAAATIDTLQLKKELQQLSLLSENEAHIIEAPVLFMQQNSRQWIVNNLGTRSIVDSRQSRLVTSFLTQADDGSPLWDYWSQATPHFSEIDFERAQQERKKRIERLDLVRKSPPSSAIYRGPLLFESEASAQLFHTTLLSLLSNAESELLLVEYAPPPIILSSLHHRLLPPGFSLFDLPSLSSFQNQSTISHTQIDGEGTLSSDLLIIDDGLLNDLPRGLSSLLPGKESNGHFFRNATSFSTTVLSCPEQLVRADLTAALRTATRDEGNQFSYAVVRFEDPIASSLFRSPLADEFRGRVHFSDIEAIRPPIPVAIDRIDLNGNRTPVRPLQISSMRLSDYRHWIGCGRDLQLHTVDLYSSALYPALLHSFLTLHPLPAQLREKPLFHTAP